MSVYVGGLDLVARSWHVSYNDKQRRETLNLELLDSVLEAQVLIDDWGEDYKTYRSAPAPWLPHAGQFTHRGGRSRKPESHVDGPMRGNLSGGQAGASFELD